MSELVNLCFSLEEESLCLRESFFRGLLRSNTLLCHWLLSTCCSRRPTHTSEENACVRKQTRHAMKRYRTTTGTNAVQVELDLGYSRKAQQSSKERTKLFNSEIEDMINKRDIGFYHVPVKWIYTIPKLNETVMVFVCLCHLQACTCVCLLTVREGEDRVDSGVQSGESLHGGEVILRVFSRAALASAHHTAGVQSAAWWYTAGALGLHTEQHKEDFHKGCS